MRKKEAIRNSKNFDELLSIQYGKIGTKKRDKFEIKAQHFVTQEMLRIMFEPQTLKFLSQLKKNNNKPWFDAHRAQYEAAKIDYLNFVQLAIDDLQRSDTTITGTTSKDCMFRINRDIRFSKDKTPYKTHFGAAIARGGRKSIYACYYFHLEPGNTFAGGGLWMPEPPNLKKVRQEIDYNWKEFEAIIRSKNFKKTFGDLFQGNNVKLSTVPKGYERDNPAIEYLKLKSLFAEQNFTNEELTKSSFHKKVVTAFKTIQPLLNFINRALENED